MSLSSRVWGRGERQAWAWPAVVFAVLGAGLAGKVAVVTDGQLSGLTNVGITLGEVAPEAAPGAASDIWYTVVVAGAVRGEMTLRFPATSGVRLAQKFLQETEPAPEEPTAEHKEALEELVRQIAGQTATALASTVGGEVQFHVAASGSPSWTPSRIWT